MAVAVAASDLADLVNAPEDTSREGEEGNSTVCGRPLTEVEANCQFTHEDVYEILKVVRDPEHPQYSLGDLKVVQRKNVFVTYSDPKFKRGSILVYLKPTVPHCGMTTQIALMLVERLSRYLPPETKWKPRYVVLPGSHHEADAITKQINDKERVCAALENTELVKEIMKFTNDEVCTI